jgi:hypothetical protein
LKDEQEEIEGAVDFDDYYYSPNNDFVDSGYGDAEEHNADGEFETHVGKDINRFACPPPLRCVSEGKFMKR